MQDHTGRGIVVGKKAEENGMKTFKALSISIMMLAAFSVAGETLEVAADDAPADPSATNASEPDPVAESDSTEPHPVLATVVAEAPEVVMPANGTRAVSYFDGSVADLTYDALSDHLQRLADDEESLGADRRRRLWVARSYIERYELGALPYDNPIIEEELEDIVSHCVLKLMRVRLEKEIGLTDLRDRVRGKDKPSSAVAMDGMRRWSISPRAGVGHDPWLGTKLRWRTTGERSSWRHADFAFGFKRHLLHDETLFGVEMATEDLNLELAHILDAEYTGDTYLLSLRWRF